MNFYQQNDKQIRAPESAEKAFKKSIFPFAVSRSKFTSLHLVQESKIQITEEITEPLIFVGGGARERVHDFSTAKVLLLGGRGFTSAVQGVVLNDQFYC